MKNIRKKGNINFIRLKVGICKVFAYNIFYTVPGFIMTILTLIFLPDLWHLSPEERGSVSIGNENLSHNSKMSNMSGGGKCFNLWFHQGVQEYSHNLSEGW